MKICLIADDSPVVRTVTAQIASAMGYITVLASSGREAIGLAESENPDIVLIDWMLDDLDSLKTLRRIMETFNRPEQQLYVMTVNTDPNVRSKYVIAGATDIITKPFDRQLLAQTIPDLMADNQWQSERQSA